MKRIWILLVLLASFANAQGSLDTTQWSYRIPITIQASQVAEDIDSMAIYFPLDSSLATFWGNVNDDGSDIRVTLADKVTLCYAQLDTFNFSVSDSAGELYFRSDVSSTVNTVFYLYYGNTGADANWSTEVWNEQYAAVYHFSENPANGSLQDWTANGNHGTLNGSISLQNGVVGQNSAHRLEIGDYISFNTAIPMSATQTIDMVIAKTGGTNQSGIIHGSNNFMGIRTNLSAYSAVQGVTTAAAILTTSFKNVIYTRLSTDAGKFYDNGALVSSNIFNEGKAYISSINGFGWDFTLESNRFFEGSFDEIRLVNTFYSENYAESQYNNMFNPETFAIAGTPENVIQSVSTPLKKRGLGGYGSLGKY